MAEHGFAICLPEQDLDPATLAGAIEDALTLPAPDDAPALDGAAVTRDVLKQHLGLR